MTAPRPGGSTPMGFRWPGNDITVDAIPSAIQNLASDVDGALGTTGAANTIMETQIAWATIGSDGWSQWITFGTLAVVQGCVASWGQDNFGPGLLLDISGKTVRVRAPLTSGLSISPPVTTPNPGPPVGSYSPQVLRDRAAACSMIAWGPPA